MFIPAPLQVPPIGRAANAGPDASRQKTVSELFAVTVGSGLTATLIFAVFEQLVVMLVPVKV